MQWKSLNGQIDFFFKKAITTYDVEIRGKYCLKQDKTCKRRLVSEVTCANSSQQPLNILSNTVTVTILY